MTSDYKRIAIIGLGQIGGSLASALNATRNVSVTGYDRDPAIAAEALRRGLIATDADGPAACAEGADIVLLAVPVRDIVGLVPEVAGVMRAGSVLLDTGSTKRLVVDEMNALSGDVRCFGGHPIAGNEKSGPDSWAGGLFVERTFVITPTTSSDTASRNEVEWLLATIGARCRSMDAAGHDKAMAITSHLPLLLAGGLVDLADRARPDIEQLSDLIGGSFSSATRVTQKPPAMTADILSTNHDQLSVAYDLFDREMRRALVMLGQDPDGFAARLSDLCVTQHRIVPEDLS